MINLIYGIFECKDSLWINLKKSLKYFHNEEQVKQIMVQVTKIRQIFHKKDNNIHIRNKLIAHIDASIFDSSSYHWINGYSSCVIDIINKLELDPLEIIKYFCELMKIIADKKTLKSGVCDEPGRFGLVTNIKIYKSYIWILLGSKKLRKQYYNDICKELKQFEDFGFIEDSISFNENGSINLQASHPS